jgi:hypothetical protein
MRNTGTDLLNLARSAIGGPYVLGAIQPKDAPHWISGDCAEFASWLLYQVSGVLYGVRSVNDDPAIADAYTGYWARDCRMRGTAIPVIEAAKIPGAFVLRSPAEKRGHIVVSDGLGGTVEAHSTARGVIAYTLTGRDWTTGVLPPGIDYSPTGDGGERA